MNEDGSEFGVWSGIWCVPFVLYNFVLRTPYYEGLVLVTRLLPSGPWPAKKSTSANFI